MLKADGTRAFGGGLALGGRPAMVTIEKKGVVWYLFRAPVYLYAGRLGWLRGHRWIERYERRHRFIAPIVRRGFSWLLGWPYRGGESDRRRLVRQLPLIAFRPRALGAGQ